VFSHGWPLSADDWDGQMLFFGQRGYRVIAHDRRGHGRSDQTRDGNEMDTYADDLAALFEKLDLKDVQEMGYHAVAVLNPLTSLADEVAFTKRIIALLDGPVILVGHSWGGAVITREVAALVYVPACAPEVGQSANDASAPFGWTEGQKQIRVDSEKSATLTSEGMLENVTEGLPMAERELAFAVQGQSYGPMFDEKLTVAAWKTKPSWFVE
jgi:hypothetical protein